MIRFRPLLVAASVVAAALGTASCGGSSSTVDNDTCQATATGAYYPEVTTNDDSNVVGQLIPQMPHNHVAEGTKVTYAHNPPTSGCHYNVADATKSDYAPIPRGVYTKQIAAEYWVHNLEHGYIVVLYDCGSQLAAGCPDDFAKIRAWVAALPVDPGLLSYQQSLTAAQQAQFQPYTKVIVVPWSNFGHKFAIESWDYYLPLDSVDTTQMQAYYNNHVGHSPESIASP